MKKLFAVATTAAAMMAFASSASAEPVRLLVAAGNKQGLAAERPLKFAGNDASRVRDVLTSFGGVKAENATLLSEPTKAALFAALDKAKAEAQKHKPEEVTLVFYFSGHGDREAVHLAGERVPLTELTQKLGEIPAGLRIAVTDACRSTRDKGFSSDEPFPISASLAQQASGQVWLHASSDGEAAQESDDIQGAIFTNAWLSGLRGAADANGDTRVTLDESFAFANAQTLIRSSKSSGVVQKPEAVINLHEAAPVVMTETVTHMGTLALPAGRDTYFLVYPAGGKTVLSELWSAPERPMMLNVPPGRYVVQRRFAGTGGIATVAVSAGEERHLTDGDFATSTLDPIAKKGEDEDRPLPTPAEAPANAIDAGWVLGTDTRTGFAQGPRVGYAHAWSPNWALAVGGELTFAARNLPENHESLTTAFGRGGVEARLPIWRWFVLHGTAGARIGAEAQTVTPHSGVNEHKQSNAAFAVGPELAAGVRATVSRAVYADLSATGALSFVSEEDALHAVPAIAGALTLGARF